MGGDKKLQGGSFQTWEQTKIPNIVIPLVIANVPEKNHSFEIKKSDTQLESDNYLIG